MKLLFTLVLSLSGIVIYCQVPYLVKDINEGSSSSNLGSGMITHNGKLYFSAIATNTERELIITDGTTEGTQLLKDIDPNSSSFPEDFIVFNNEVFFTARVNFDQGLWKTDGTPAGTQLVIPESNWIFSNFTVFNNELYFIYRLSGVVELWKSDGSTSGTINVSSILPYQIDTPDINMMEHNGLLYISYKYSSGNSVICKTDGTASGTQIIKDDFISVDSNNAGFFIFNNDIVFSAKDSNTNGFELWKTDGTTSGTILVKDINQGSFNSGITNFTLYNNELYFTAIDGIHGYELWKTDGSSTGTILVKDINQGYFWGLNPSFIDIEIFNNELYFNADDGIHGDELWKTDGTASGTIMVKDINQGIEGSVINYFTSFEGSLYFSAIDGIHGNELWNTDGTTNGTNMVKDVVEGTNGSGPIFLTVLNDVLLYSGVIELQNGETFGRELLTLGDCTDANGIIQSSFQLEDNYYNNQVQNETTNETCFCNVYNKVINKVIPSGALPFTEIIINKVIIEDIIPQEHVSRHYEIIPDANAINATGEIVLYFTQEEFDEFNNLQTQLIPTNPSDDTNKANIRIKLVSDLNSVTNSTNDSNSESIIDPNEFDIIWNSDQNRWEISFATIGFGKYYLTNEVNTLNIEDKEYKSIKIYPNPIQNNLFTSGVFSNLNFNIYNLQGKIIKSGIVSDSKPINLNQLKSGLYLLILENGITKKIIKE